MITNWYTLEKLSLYLNKILSQEVISEAITFNKNELILLNKNPNNSSLKINLFNPFQFILLDKFPKPKKYINIFPNLKNNTINSVKIDKKDRNIWFNMENGSSIVIIFRSNSGNVIFLNDSEHISFKKNKDQSLDNLVYSDNTPKFDNIDDNFRFNNFWKNNYNKYYSVNSNNYNDLLYTIKNSNGNIVNNRFVLNKNSEDENCDLEIFYHNYKNFIIGKLITNNFEKEYGKIKNKISELLQNSKKNLSHLNDLNKIDKRIEKCRFYGDTLSIFQTKIDNSIKKFEIPDIYQNSQFNNTIELKSNLNIHQNIKYYYDKAKKLETRKEKNISEKSNLENEIKKYSKIFEYVENINTYKELKLWKEKNKHFLQKIHKTKNKQKENVRVPYKEYITKSGWKIWVGKSARDNDKMTFELANKNDLWLHSQHTTGSHVIIRKDGKKEIPMNVIEYAGKLAARFSDAKHSNMVPVIYTIKKYVTKRKGFTAGKVTFQYEKSIFVNPLEL